MLYIDEERLKVLFKECIEESLKKLLTEDLDFRNKLKISITKNGHEDFFEKNC